MSHRRWQQCREVSDAACKLPVASKVSSSGPCSSAASAWVWRAGRP